MGLHVVWDASDAWGGTICIWHYRSGPEHWKEIIGQEAYCEDSSQSDQGELWVSRLVAGTRSTGKTTARILAKAVNYCSDPSKPCGECHCRALQRGDSRCREAGRGIQQWCGELRCRIDAISPTVGKYKVYIIDEAHMLTRFGGKCVSQDARRI